jgi:RHS repeat-associated protein
MAGGELVAAAEGLAGDADQAAGQIGESAASWFEKTADTEDSNLSDTLDTESANTRRITEIGAMGERTEEQTAAGARPAAEGSPVVDPASSGRGAGGVGSGGSVGGSGDPVPLSVGDPVDESIPPGGKPASDDPVDVVTGEMFLPQRDLALPGLLPLVLERVHLSNHRKGRWFGRSWASTLDQRIEVDADGVHYAAPDGVVLHYPTPSWPGQSVLAVEGARWPLTWDEEEDTFRIEQPESGRTLHFPPGAAPGIARPLAAVSDRNGNRIMFVYDQDGVPMDVVHSGGYHVVIESIGTSAGVRIAALRLAGGGQPDTTIVSFGYDARGRLTDVVNSSGQPVIFEYDNQDRITSWTDRNGYRYEYHFDESGRVVRAQGTNGFLTATFDYDLAAHYTTLTDSLGFATVYYWNEQNQVVKAVDPLGGETRTEQDRYGRLLSSTDPLGNTTRFVRDDQGDPVWIERADGSGIAVEYNELRLPVRVIGPDEATWWYTYDERGNLTSVNDPLGAITGYSHGERGEVLAMTDALGQVTWYESNAAGLPVSVTDPLGARTQVERDAFGQISELMDALGAVCRLGWTVEGRPAWQVTPDGAREEWAYDGEGNLLEHRDANGGLTVFEYGPFDKPVSRTDPSGTSYTFAYDTELRLTAVTNPQNLIWRYAYDGADNLVGETDFNDRGLTYRYDIAGQLIERANGAGQTATFLRDVLGRVAERHTGAAVYRFAHNAAGLLSSAQGPDSTLALTRDALGRILSESVDGRTMAYEYDALGRRVSRTTPTNAVSQWTYDAAGLPSSLATIGGGLTFDHDAAGRETNRYLGPGAALSQSFDLVGRLTGQAIWAYDQPDRTGQPDQLGQRGPLGQLGQLGQFDESDQPTGAEPEYRSVQQRTYTYRSDGFPVQVTDDLRGTRRYDLDPVGRVTAVHAATWTETYAYDGLGNVARATAPDDPDGEREHSGTLIRRAGRTTYEHDAQGRVIRTVHRTLSGQVRRWTYLWDADDRLTSVTTPDGVIWRYRYDPLGRRTSKRRLAADGTVAEETWFAWDGSRLAEQATTAPDGQASVLTWDWEPGTHRAAAQTHRTWATGAPQAEIDTAFYAIVTDLVGTPTELVTPNGRIAWHTTTSLWGGVITSPDAETDCPLRFPGQYHDRETGLDYNLFRYYDSGIGSYITPDPLGLDPAPNHHAYVDNPLAWVDPVGLYPATPSGTPGGAPPQTVINEPEVVAPKPLKPAEVPEAWKNFLGDGPYTNIHPRTGAADPDRLVSADGLRSIRMGPHEMNSKLTKFHYHEESWSFESPSNTWTVKNTMVRVPILK